MAVFSTGLGCFHCKSRFLLLPIYTATVVRRLVFSTATALGLFAWGGASTGEEGVPTCDSPGCLTVVTLRVSEALAALAFQRSFGAAYYSTDTRKPQSSVSDRTFDTSGLHVTDIMKWAWQGDPCRASGRDGRIEAA